MSFERRAALVLALLLVSAWSVPGQEKKAEPKLPEGVKAERDLEYGPHGVRNKLDLYLPKADGPLPLVIWVHGGGWVGGSKDGNNPVLPLLTRGYAVASINYRLSDQAKFPAQIEDCKAAVRFLRANARKYDLDPDRFGAWGASAGGHLVALLGTCGGDKELEGDGRNKDVSSRVQAVCDWFGPTDLLTIVEQSKPGDKFDFARADSPVGKLLGGPVTEKKGLAKKASPVTYIDKGCPPMLIVHGDKDDIVPVAQSEELHEALKKAGLDSTLIVVKGAGHGNGIGTRENLDKIVAFFDKHLKKGTGEKSK